MIVPGSLVRNNHRGNVTLWDGYDTNTFIADNVKLAYPSNDYLVEPALVVYVSNEKDVDRCARVVGLFVPRLGRIAYVWSMDLVVLNVP